MAENDPETSQDIESAMDWDTDAANPHNWSVAVRLYHTAIPALFGFAVTFGSSVYTSAIPDVMRDLEVSRTVAMLGLSVYLVGLGVGPIFTAPLSEGHGRRIVYMVSSPIFMLFTLGAGFSNNFASLCVCRFFAGLSGSPALAVGAGTNADLFSPRQRALTASMFVLAPFLGPTFGPIVGGFVAQYKTWEWTQWCIIFVTLAVFVMALPMKETYKPIILQQRARKLGLPPPAHTGGPGLKQTFVLKFVRPVHMLLTEPVVFFLSLYTAFAFAVLYLFFAAFPFIFARSPYNFSPSESGLTFIPIGVGVILGSITSMAIGYKVYEKKLKEASADGRTSVQPEHHLYSAMLGSCGVVISLFWFGWCADKGVHWAPTLIGAIPFGWGTICLFTSSIVYIVDVYGPLNGASAVAGNGIARYVGGAVFPLFSVQMYEKLGVGWATSLIGMLALCMVPIPFVFFKYGPSIRAKSRYPVADY